MQTQIKTTNKRSMKLLLLFATVALPTAMAVQATSKPFTVTQASTGKNITLQLNGGEHFNWLTLGVGNETYTVLRKSDGDFVFAELMEDGTLGLTDDLVGDVDPEEKGIPKSVQMSDEARDQECMDKGLLCAESLYDDGFEDGDERRSLQSIEPVGNIKNLVVLLRWSDHADRTLPPVEDIEVLMNAEEPDEKLAPTGSVRKYYQVQSYGKLNLTSTIYPMYVTMDNTEAFYADGASGTSQKILDAIRYALQQLDNDPSFDFTQFDSNGDSYIDAITFLHSGYGAEVGEYDINGVPRADRIWSHKWALGVTGEFTSADGIKVNTYHISPAVWGLSGSDIGRIGVIAHETGHFFGLPDLYDGQYIGQGIGSYCLMANSWGFDQSQLYPPHLSAWSRWRLGWDQYELIDQEGTYEVSAAGLADADSPRIYRIEVGYPKGEYLLIENRQPQFYDGLIENGGLAIWHINLKQRRGQGRQGFPGQEGWPTNGNHYRIAILQSDSRYDLEKGFDSGDGTDLYRGDGVDEIGPSSGLPGVGPYPNTDAYQGGNVYRTGHRIHNISVGGDKMTFTFSMSTVGSSEDDEDGDATSAGMMMAAMHKMFLVSVAAAGVLVCLY